MASASGSLASLIPALAVVAFGLAACGDSDNNKAIPDAGLADAPVPPDSGTSSCDPSTVLPSGYTPVAKVATTLVNVTTTAGVSSGTIDATAGGIAGAADNPYIYVDLKNGVRVDVNDIEARTSTTWDIGLKRSSPHLNGGDAGAGNRKLAIVDAATLDAVTAAPTTGYTTDDYTTDDCMLSALPGGEPLSAFGQWYDYNDQTHVLTPMSKVYVIERNNGSHTAFRITTYYGDTTMPMRGAYYGVEWKQLP